MNIMDELGNINDFSPEQSGQAKLLDVQDASHVGREDHAGRAGRAGRGGSRDRSPGDELKLSAPLELVSLNLSWDVLYL